MRRTSFAALSLTATTVLAVVLALVIIATLRNPVDGPVMRYHATFTDASGLVVGNDVRIAGVQVGKVEAIGLEGRFARVDFNVRTDRPIYSNTVVGIRYQSLLGQRYVELSQPSKPSEQLIAGAAIPIGQTVPSFDVAKLFNGFRPIFQTLDPAQFNQFGENLLRLIQGDEIGIGPLLHDIDAVMKVAVNRQATLVGIIANLGYVSDELRGTSRQLFNLITSLSEILVSFTAKAEAFNAAIAHALPALRNVVGILRYAEHTLDATGLPVYDLMSRMFPQTPTIMAGVALLPDLVQGMRDSLVEDKPTVPTFRCSNGVVDLPGVGQISFAEQELVICK